MAQKISHYRQSFYVIPMKEGSSAGDEAGFYGRHAKRQSAGVIALALTRAAEDFPLSFETTIGLVIRKKEERASMKKARDLTSPGL